MATYKYQQNFFEGASAGYVQYNISPDFGTVLAPGDTFEVTGKMYCGDMKRYGMTIEASIQENGFGRELGRVVKTVAKGGSTTFSAKCTVTDALVGTASERGFSAYLTFMLVDTADFSSGAYTIANAAQKLSLVKYRLAPEISSVTFSDETGAYEHFSGAVQGKSDLFAVTNVALDPLDESLYIQSARIIFGDNEIDIPSSKISNGKLHIGAPGFNGEFESFEVLITDSFGMTGSYTGGAFVAYPYEAPRFDAIGRDLVERYEVVLNDDGTEVAQISDSGTYLWTNFIAETSSVNGKNAWSIKRSFAESGFDLPDGVQVLSGNDGEMISVVEDQSIFPRSMVFSASKRYTIRMEITDFFEKAVLVFDVDKAGGYFNIEKHGVSVGMRSTATENSPKFESAYPVYAYAGIDGVTNYVAEETKTGGTWLDGKAIYRSILTLPSISAANSWYFSEDRIANVDTIIKYDAIIDNMPGSAQGRVVNAPLYRSSTDYTVAILQRQVEDASLVGLTYWTNSTSMLAKRVMAIVYYTKTVDEEPEPDDGGDGDAVEVIRPAAAMTSASSQNCVVSASSEYGSSYAAWKAFDKTSSNMYGWASKETDSNKWIQLKMDVALKDITVTITNRTRSSLVNGIKAGSILGSNDGSTWTMLCSISGRDGTKSNGSTTHECNNETAYSYVRVKVTSSANNSYVAVGEITIKGYAKE